MNSEALRKYKTADSICRYLKAVNELSAFLVNQYFLITFTYFHLILKGMKKTESKNDRFSNHSKYFFCWLEENDKTILNFWRKNIKKVQNICY